VTLTPAQRAAVTLAGRDVCVVAGAGSGKTLVLAERFAHHVLGRRSVEDRLRAVDRLLTLTFTEKAATEMRERVARRFLAEGRPDLRRAVETAWVSTFHSFCARLLKENAVEAGVDPSFQVLAEGDAALLLEEAREETVLRWGEERPGDLAPLALIAASDFEELIDGLLADGPGTGRTFAEMFAEAAAPPDAGPGLADLRGALDGLLEGRRSFNAAGTTRADRVLDAARALPGEREIAADLGVLAAPLAAVRRSVNLQCGSPAKEALRAVRDAAEALDEVLVALAAMPAARSLAAFLDDAAAAYARRKREHGALDFTDLERQALDLLENDAEVREEARERFDAVLVDEFQDTSPVQERLLAALSVPGRRFVVGDPKQAIYGFRGTDVGGFERARDAAGKEGTVLLVENFRSRPEVLRFSNAVLRPAFEAGGAGQVRFERLEPGAAHGRKEGPSVEVHLVGGEGLLGDLRPREAALVAARIRALVAGREGCITRCDTPGRPEGSPLEWRDAAILLRATTDIKVYERALADADVPYQVVKGRGFYEAREVVDLANLLLALEDPADDLALAATLRSPFAGLDDGALLALFDSLPRTEDRRGPLSAVLDRAGGPPEGLVPEMRRRLDRFRAAWDVLRDLRRHGRLHALVEAALRETGYDLAVLLRPGGRQRAANLRKVRERARSFEADGLGGPGEFVRLLRRLRLREERETEAPLAADDAVSLLSIHQAKGLEWPLVCVPDLARGGGEKSSPVLVRGGRAGLRLRGEREGVPTPLWSALRDESVLAGNAEEVRLLHVAVTRAKEHLLLSASVKAAPEGKARRAPDPEKVKRLRAYDVLLPHLPPSLLGLGRLTPPSPRRLRGASPPPSGDAPAEEDRVLPLAKGTPDEVDVRLVRTGGPSVEGGGARRVSLAALRRKRLLAGRGPGPVPGGKFPAKERRAVEREVDAVLDLPPIAADGTPYLATVSAVLDFEACPLRYWLGHVLGAPDRAPPSVAEPAPSRDFPAARGDATLGGEPGRRLLRPGADDEEWEGGAGGDPGVPRWISGVAVHAVLGTMDFAKDDEAALREAARARLREELDDEPPPEALEQVLAWVRAFRESPLGRAVGEAARLHGKGGEPRLLREVPFLAREEGVLLRGQIDLVFRDDGGAWTLADYKAARAPKHRAHRARYERQLRLYARALRGVPPFRGAPEFRGALVYLDPKPEVVDVALDDGALESARGLLQRFAKFTGAEKFPPDRSHCPACPFGPGGRRSCAEAAGRGESR
jgi:ATP-dependent helicase/nuclease subunit A